MASSVSVFWRLSSSIVVFFSSMRRPAELISPMQRSCRRDSSSFSSTSTVTSGSICAMTAPSTSDVSPGVCEVRASAFRTFWALATSAAAWPWIGEPFQSAAALLAPAGSLRSSSALKSAGVGFGQGPSLQWDGTDTTTSGARKLSEALEEADIDRKKAIEEAERRAK